MQGQGFDLSKGRLVIAVIVALVSIASYYSSSSRNPVTGEVQHIGNITPAQEVQMGLQAVPEMVRQFQGESDDARASELVRQVGTELVRESDASRSDYRFQFHLLADRQTINAFALPGGQVFITEALLGRLETRGQLAGVLGHEIGHVLARHGAERMAKQQLTQGLVGAAVHGADGSGNTAQIAQMVGGMINMKYGREDELQSDELGLRFMTQSGYDPRAMIGVMKILEKASGGSRQPEFMSTHPNPGNRIGAIEQHLREMFPNGVPDGLEP